MHLRQGTGRQLLCGALLLGSLQTTAGHGPGSPATPSLAPLFGSCDSFPHPLTDSTVAAALGRVPLADGRVIRVRVGTIDCLSLRQKTGPYLAVAVGGSA